MTDLDIRVHLPEWLDIAGHGCDAFEDDESGDVCYCCRISDNMDEDGIVDISPDGIILAYIGDDVIDSRDMSNGDKPIMSYIAWAVAVIECEYVKRGLWDGSPLQMLEKRYFR